MLRAIDCVLLIIDCNVFVDENSWNFVHSMGLLLERFVWEPKGSDFVKINYYGHYCDLLKSV